MVTVPMVDRIIALETHVLKLAELVERSANIQQRIVETFSALLDKLGTPKT
jgi:hypothetical protein